MKNDYTVTCTKAEAYGRCEFDHNGKTVVVMYPTGVQLPAVGESRCIRSYGNGSGSFWVDVTGE